MDDVERVFRHLVEVLADEHPDRINKPLQASEIYQTLLPYRRYRSALMFDTNQDYEMAILRLLAGDHGYASVEPPQAQAELRAEADAVNPNPAVIREYAGVKVFLNANVVREMIDGREAYAPPEEEAVETEIEQEPDKESEIETFVATRYELEVEAGDEPDVDTPNDSTESLQDNPIDPEENRPDPEEEDEEYGDVEVDVISGDEFDSEEEDKVQPEEVAGEEEVDRDAEVADSSSETSPLDSGSGPTDGCVHCGESLPSGRRVTFCPFCGTNQSVRLCPECDAELEDGWVYCVECGAAVEP